MTKQQPEDMLADHLTWAGIEHVRQYQFAKERMKRKWKSDFFIPPDLLVEVEGGVFRGGVGHNSVSGILRDIEKGNAATLLGYRSLRVHSDHVKNGDALKMIEQLIGRTIA